MMSSLNDEFRSLRDPSMLNCEPMKPYGNVSVHSEDADQDRMTYGISVDGDDSPSPILSFQDMNLPKSLFEYLTLKKKFAAPTPIQMQAISCLLNGRDVIAIGPTGSGKSFAYLLPMCVLLKGTNNLAKDSKGMVCPKCLILVPTRELVTQISNVAQELISCLEDKSDIVQTISGFQYQSTSPAHILGRALVDGYNPPWHPYVSDGLSTSHPSCSEAFSLSSVTGCIDLTAPCGNLNYSQGSSANIGWFPGQKVMADFTANSPGNQIMYRVVGVCGGFPVKSDVEKIKCGVNVLVATPGRLLDLCERKLLSLEMVSYFVIDECDKSLEMGLEEQLRKIVAMVNVGRVPIQTSLWSATLPDSLERLVRSAVFNPIFISTGVRDTVAVNVTQHVVFMHSYKRQKFLLDTLRQTPFPPAIVFVNTIESANEIGQLLASEQFHVAVLHSEKGQVHRSKVMDAFNKGRVDVLVATDLASRGLDLPDVTHVINYDIPFKIEDYIHRCGRTGRFGRKGISTSCLTLECKIASDLKDLLESTGNFVPAELVDTEVFGRKVIKTAMGDRVAE